MTHASRRDVTLPVWAEVTVERRAHIERVAAMLDVWADRLQVSGHERHRWQRAAWLHDALKDAPVARLRELAPDAWDIDAIRHGPAAANLAQHHGEGDQGVLDAVRYHSVGFAGWDDVGRMLYLADYLEPGRGFLNDERAKLAERVPANVTAALCIVVNQRLDHLRRRQVTPLDETVDFFRSLACGDD